MPLPVFETVRLAYSDAWRAIRTFPVLWFVSLLLYVVLSGLSEGTSDTTSATETPIYSIGWAIETLALFLSAACIIPAALLSHRLILLGGPEPLNQAFQPPGRVVRYGALEAATILLIEIPRTLVKSFESSENVTLFYLTPVLFIALLLISIGAVVLLAAVYPAIALDSDRAELMAAFHASRAQFWRILSIAFLTTGPFVAVLIIALIGRLDTELPRTTLPWNIIAHTALGGAAVLWIAAMSNIYLGLNRPRPPSQASG